MNKKIRLVSFNVHINKKVVLESFNIHINEIELWYFIVHINRKIVIESFSANINKNIREINLTASEGYGSKSSMNVNKIGQETFAEVLDEKREVTEIIKLKITIMIWVSVQYK